MNSRGTESPKPLSFLLGQLPHDLPNLAPILFQRGIAALLDGNNSALESWSVGLLWVLTFRFGVSCCIYENLGIGFKPIVRIWGFP